MKKIKSNTEFIFFFSGLTAGILILVIVGFYGSKNKEAGRTAHFNNSDLSSSNKIISPKIPDKIEFAGEKVPLENFEVKERIDREMLVNVYWYSSTILGMKRANRWFPVIEPILKKNNIPDDFKYLAVIESNLTNSVSYAGAVGFWQLTEDVAKKYGLEVNDEVDERYNVEKSTEAACKYLLDAYNEFKSWTLAAAAFNMGKNGLEKQIEKQRVHNYYNLLLSEETLRYVARIISMKLIFNDPEEYGYELNRDVLYPPLKTHNIEINSSVENWTDFAFNHGINYKILKYYNPWLRDISLTNKKKKVYEIKIPDKGMLEMTKDETQ
ncbi:MAG: lytic transglycosylase domain-containing protein [Bacteroidetes bacterium]|nr:lytic transglycosylase domain-containing protein [Bacteroidota bacterium]